MITPQQLARAFARNVQVVKWQTEGLTDEEGLIQTPFRANCMSWVVGHLVTNRDEALRLLGESPTLDAAITASYERESEAITGPGASPLGLAELVARLEAAQAKLAPALEAATPAMLAADGALYGGRMAPVQEHLFFLFFHDSYHTGQTELLRQAAGRDDKII